ncbi:zf-HC2 domain-containing protein [Streptomyces sp. NPDC059909]|uniref:zf-HC2 domain-containing protein n=1 Tax=Streptomyces sp. NPDC059909 TaxID=3346998 RepID=UPI00364B1DC3
MNLRERHRDVAAYALGVLDPSDAFRFEEHLSECVLCAVRLADFTPVSSALAELAGPGRPLQAVSQLPSPSLLDRLLREVAVRRRHSSRRRLRLVAAAAALIVALPVVMVGLMDGNGGGGPDARIVATDAATGVHGAVDLRTADWGTAVALRMAQLRGPRTCELVVVDRDGKEHKVTTWSVPAGGYGIAGSPGNENPLDLEAATALRPGEIDRFEVRTMRGERLVTLDR